MLGLPAPQERRRIKLSPQFLMLTTVVVRPLCIVGEDSGWLPTDRCNCDSTAFPAQFIPDAATFGGISVNPTHSWVYHR